MSFKPLGMTCGDPAGVGPEVTIRAVEQLPAHETVAIYGDAERLHAIADGFRVPRSRLRIAAVVPRRGDGTITLVHTGQWPEAALLPEPTAASGQVQITCLERALADARAGRTRGLVTGPMNKLAVQRAGHAFVGHTEYLATGCGLHSDDVTMLFLGPRLRLALVTTHVAVRDVPDALTQVRVARSARHLGEALVRLDAPGYARGRRVVVAGLNPHAGEGGLFGFEEAQTILPGVRIAQAAAPYLSELTVEGPMPAEAAVRLAASGAVAGVVMMMHDQATIASKALDWGAAVNVTWGLPFVRTSVDHGVGYDAVLAGRVDPSGMRAALALALRLSPEQPLSPTA